MDKDQFHDQTVYFHVHCHELKNNNVITKMDTFCTLSMEDGKEIDRTEIQKANQSPSYMKALSIVRSSHEESSVSEFVPITFTIFNSYFANYKSHEDFIGRVCVNIHTLATSPNGVINLTLVDKNNVDIGATITIRFEDKIAQDFKFDLQFAGSDLAKKDLFGKSDPYFIISREINGRSIDIYKSAYIKNNLDPIWAAFRMTFKNFCDCDENLSLKMTVYDWDSLTESDYIGDFVFTFKELKNTSCFTLKDGKKSTGKIYVRNLDLSNMPSSI